MKIKHYLYDLPDEVKFKASVAIDTETMGLKLHRDRLCLVQLSGGDGECHLVQFPKPDFTKSYNLKKLLQDKAILKIFHYARFDVAALMHSFNIEISNLYCTKIASFLTRTASNKHSLKDLCKELLNIELNKQEQTSDWGDKKLTPEQMKYAATDVLHLHHIKQKLDTLLVREKRMELAQACFQFLPFRARIDLLAGEDFDIFSHKI